MDARPDNIYFSWTGAVPQSPWQPSSAFLHFLNTDLCGNHMWEERKAVGWASDAMVMTQEKKKSATAHGKGVTKRRAPKVLTANQRKYLSGQKFSKKDFAEMDLAVSMVKKVKEKA
jgi:hypothetical protein